MSDLRTAAQQALEALENLQPIIGNGLLNKIQLAFIDPNLDVAITALRAALAQQYEPVQEPVGYLPTYELNRLQSGHDGRLRSAKFGPSSLDEDVALYTAPPQRPPLTQEEILKAIGWERAEMYMKLATNFPVDEAKQETLKNARAVERAVWEKNHG